MIKEIAPGAPELVLCLSNMNLPRRDIALGGSERYREVLQDINQAGQPFNGGYEITPTRVLERELRQGTLSENGSAEDGSRWVSSMHQTWPKTLWAGTFGPRRERTVRGLIQNHAGYILMPEAQRSLAVASDMERYLGTAAMCGYPESGTNFAPYTSFAAAQPHKGFLAQHGGLKDYSKFHYALWYQDVVGIIPDTHHLQVDGLDWEAVLAGAKAMGTNIMGVHLSVGRTDSKSEAERTRSENELDALMQGPEAFGETTSARILAKAYAIAVAQRTERRLPESRYALVAADEPTVWPEPVDRRDSVLASAASPAEVRLRQEELYREHFFLPRHAGSVQVTLEMPCKPKTPYASFVRVTRQIGATVAAFLKSPDSYLQENQ